MASSDLPLCLNPPSIHLTIGLWAGITKRKPRTNARWVSSRSEIPRRWWSRQISHWKWWYRVDLRPTIVFISQLPEAHVWLQGHVEDIPSGNLNNRAFPDILRHAGGFTDDGVGAGIEVGSKALSCWCGLKSRIQGLKRNHGWGWERIIIE